MEYLTDTVVTTEAEAQALFPEFLAFERDTSLAMGQDPRSNESYWGDFLNLLNASHPLPYGWGFWEPANDSE